MGADGLPYGLRHQRRREKEREASGKKGKEEDAADGRGQVIAGEQCVQASEGRAGSSSVLPSACGRRPSGCVGGLSR